MLLKSIFGDLGKQYKLPTPLKQHMSGLALQGLKLILLLNNIQNLGYLKGHPFMAYTNTEIVYSTLLPWIVFLRNCPFLVK